MAVQGGAGCCGMGCTGRGCWGGARWQPAGRQPWLLLRVADCRAWWGIVQHCQTVHVGPTWLMSWHAAAALACAGPLLLFAACWAIPSKPGLPSSTCVLLAGDMACELLGRDWVKAVRQREQVGTVREPAGMQRAPPTGMQAGRPWGLASVSAVLAAARDYCWGSKAHLAGGAPCHLLHRGLWATHLFFARGHTLP